MSEYQYYEFRSIDRSLTNSEFEKIKKLSSRGDVSRHHAIFEYSYGDFRYDPIRLLAKYFDVMLYSANWGTRRLCFRLPKNLVNLEEIKHYCLFDIITVSTVEEYIIVDIHLNLEPDGWINHEGVLSELLSLRNNLLQGNYQSLYIAWLSALADENCDVDDNLFEPPIPPGLKTLSGPLKQLIDFLNVDVDLVEVAADNSEEITSINIDLKQWLHQLPASSRDNFLLRLLDGEPNIDMHLRKKLLEIAKENSVSATFKNKQRTSKELIEAADLLTAKKKEQKKLAQLKIKQNKLKALAQQEIQLWAEVFNQINSKTTKGYDKAVSLLKDLKDVAHFVGTMDQFIQKTKNIQNEYRRYSALQAKIRNSNLICS